MSKTHRFITPLACLVAASLCVCQARAQAPPAPRPTIATVNIAEIFQKHARFQAAVDLMKAEAKRTGEALQAKRTTIQQEHEVLKGLQVGSPDYSRKEQEIARRFADLNIEMEAQSKEFTLKRSRLYYQVYREIQGAIAYYANTQGYKTVLRYDNQPATETNPDDVLRYVSQNVIWADESVNITGLVLDGLNRTSTQPQHSTDRRSIPSGGNMTVPSTRR